MTIQGIDQGITVSQYIARLHDGCGLNAVLDAFERDFGVTAAGRTRKVRIEAMRKTLADMGKSERVQEVVSPRKMFLAVSGDRYLSVDKAGNARWVSRVEDASEFLGENDAMTTEACRLASWARRGVAMKRFEFTMVPVS